MKQVTIKLIEILGKVVNIYVKTIELLIILKNLIETFKHNNISEILYYIDAEEKVVILFFIIVQNISIIYRNRYKKSEHCSENIKDHKNQLWSFLKKLLKLLVSALREFISSNDN